MHSTVSHGNNTYVFSVDKHREHYIFALNTSEPILMLAAPTTGGCKESGGWLALTSGIG